MKKIKMHSYLVIFLATLSLISVGFASWVASNGMTTSTNGTIIVEDVLKVNEYITCSSGDITEFSYFGFIDNNGNISTSGKLTAKVTINMAKCKSEFSDCNSIEFNLVLFSENLSVFKNTDKMSFSASIFNTDNEGNKTTKITSTGSTSDDGKEYTLKFYMDNDSDMMLNLILEYNFEIEEDGFDYFSQTVYPILKEDAFSFSVMGKLTGIKEA